MCNCCGCLRRKNLANMSMEPYPSAKDKKRFKFSNEMLCNKVLCRATIRHNEGTCIKVPCPSSWSFELLHSYLLEFLTKIPADVKFLQVEIKRHFHSLVAATLLEKSQIPATPNSRIFFNLLADLRVIHVLIDDSIKSAYLR